MEPNRAQLIALAKLVDGGQLRVVIDSTFTLAEAAAAFERSLTSGKHGKVVIEWPMTRTLHIERPSRSDQAPGGELEEITRWSRRTRCTRCLRNKRVS